MRLIYWILQLLFPSKCILCGCVLGAEETDLCHKCRMEGPVYPSHKRKIQFLDSFTAVWYYKGYVRKSLHRFKVRNARACAGPYGRLLAMKLLEDHPEGFDLLTWIPVSPWRKFCRGYDQSELIAREVGRQLGMEPVALLRKVRHNRQQSRIQDAPARRANVMGVYRAENPELFRDKRILLVDDILTTGSTAGEGARVLLTAGAKEVHCGAVAAAHNK